MKVVMFSALRTGSLQLPPTPQKYSSRDRVDPGAIVQLEELRQWKIPMAQSGIESATFQLNQLRHCVPQPKYSLVFTSVNNGHDQESSAFSLFNGHTRTYYCKSAFPRFISVKFLSFEYTDETSKGPRK